MERDYYLILIGQFSVLNQEAIIDEYCVNLDQPTKMCNASCYLNDVLLNNDETTSSEVILISSIIEINFFITDSFSFPIFKVNEFSKIKNSFFYKRQYGIDLYDRIDHPPQV